ncbi:MAG: hypothetical protein SNJ56_03750, partial [Termitinemataceae bacterium]
LELQELEANALLAYFKHMDQWFIRVRSLFIESKSDDKKLLEALYLLGVLMHSYQDLWAHYGITNEMHRALLKHRGIDVDRDPVNIACMEERLANFVRALPNILGAEAGPIFVAAVQSNREFPVPTVQDRKKLLGRGRDIFIEGINYVVFTSDSEKALTYIDQIRWDAPVIDMLLQDPIALHQAAQQKNGAALVSFLKVWGYSF